MKRRPKPVDYMTPEQLEAHALKLLTDATKAAAKIRGTHGRWRRSRATRAICNAGPGWYPELPGRPS